jgi:glycosyltransferase involved in cell wall biosynthesis
MYMKKISAVICTYNGARRVPDVLEQLKLQQETDGISWEVLVVDNNSSDDTAQVVRGFQEGWPGAFPLKYSFEPQPGKQNAIRRAFKEVEGAFIAFLDDDNVPDPDWIKQVHCFIEEHPNVGAVGSFTRGEYEVPPPPGFGDIENLYAIRSEEHLFQYERDSRHFPAGAGLVICKEAYETSVPAELRQKGTMPGSRSQAADDMEMQWYILQNGWEIWHNPSMRLTHKIPASRFTKEYQRWFFSGLGLGRYDLRMIRHTPMLRPFYGLAYMAYDLAHAAKYGVRSLRKREDLSSRGRMILHVYAFLSPLCHWKERLVELGRIRNKSAHIL